MKFTGLLLDERDYTGNIPATDSEWFYRETNFVDQDPPVGNGVYNSLEFDFGRGGSHQIQKVVYVRGSDITINLKFYNPLPFTNFSGTMTINGARIAVPTDPISYEYLEIEDDSIPFTCNAQSYQTVTVTLTDVPNYVTFGQLQLDAVVTGNIGHQIPCEPSISWTTSGWTNNWETVFLTYDEPTDMQEVPWTDLLEYACWWAMGVDTADEVTEWITYNMFWASPWAYDGGIINFWGGDGLPSTYDDNSYWLSRALTEPSIDYMDCKDVLGFVSLACQALGVSVQCRRLEADDELNFWTNPLCGMGNDASVDENPFTFWPTYEPYSFDHHQVAIGGSLVYDAACAQKYNLSGGTYRQPPRGWSLYGYWQTWYNPGYWGLVSGRPGSPPTIEYVELQPYDHAIDDLD